MEEGFGQFARPGLAGFTEISGLDGRLRRMKRSIRLAAPLLAAALLVSCGSDPQALFESGKKAFAAQDYNTARVNLAAALREDPANKAMLLLLARAQLRLGDPEGAGSTLRRLKALNVAGAEIVRLDAEVLLLRQKFDAVLALLDNDDTSLEAWRLRAKAHVGMGNRQAAAEAYERGLAAGNDVRLAAEYAQLMLEEGNTARAENLLAAMRGFAPRAYETLLLAGDLAAARGETDAAIAAYSALAKAFPARPEPLLALANEFDTKGQIDAAIAVLKQAEKIAPGDYRVEKLGLQLYSVKGEWNKVREILQPREGTLDPRTSEGLTYAEAMLRLGHAEQARAYFNRAVLLSPQNRYARMMLGEAQLATGDARLAYETLKPLVQSVLVQPQELDLAEKAAREAGNADADMLRARRQAMDSDQTLALVRQAQAAAQRLDWNGAINAYQALLTSGQDAEVLKRLAFACSQAGRHDEAIGHADQARSIDPANLDLIHMAGLVRLNGNRDLGEARRLLRLAANGDPANVIYKASAEKAKAAAG